MPARGFTLFELLVALLILVLLLTIGVPSLSHQIQNTRTQAALQDLLQSVQHARTLAVSQNQRATLVHKGSWGDGWELFIDANNNGVRDGNEALIFEGTQPEGVKVYSNGPVRDYISFIGTGESRKVGRANGGSFQAGTLRVCPENDGDGFQLVLARSGRMRVESVSADACVAFNG